jgi:hypothetical protein
MRPREEWIPLELPESLRLVPRGRWERVQQRIQRNIAFSPRNEKHFYLLKGLVKCGGCGCAYVGDPCHGRFYYRCLKRCKQQPSVAEGRLDNAVMESVEEMLRNPSLVLDELEYLRRSAEEADRNRRNTRVQADKDLGRIQTEETRLLEAYRTEIISPAQLGVELDRLKVRRKIAEAQRAESGAVASGISLELVRKPVEEYCAEAVHGLRSLSEGDLREFLRAIIRAIIFEGSQIRIQGHLPVGGVNSNATAVPEVAFVRSAGLRSLR